MTKTELLALAELEAERDDAIRETVFYQKKNGVAYQKIRALRKVAEAADKVASDLIESTEHSWMAITEERLLEALAEWREMDDDN